MWSRLQTRAHAAIETDPAPWKGYGVRPLWAVTQRHSPLMDVLGDAVRALLDFEIDQQQADGRDTRIGHGGVKVEVMNWTDAKKQLRSMFE